MKYFLFILCLFFNLLSFSKSTIPLYTIEKHALPEFEKKQQAELIRTAMTDVLVKVTGDRRLIDNEAISAFIQTQAPNALQRFNYLDQGDNRLIKFTFSEPFIKNMLAQYHLTFWPSQRPDVLVWLTHTPANASHNWHFVSEETQANFITALKRQAEWRGLPVNFPMLDLQDRQFLNESEPLATQLPLLKKLSKRYRADHILAISVSPSETGGYHSTWQLINESEQIEKNINSKNSVELFTNGIDQITDIIAERNVLLMETLPTAKQLQFSVTQIRSVEDYLKVTHYLKHLSGVKHLEITAVDGDRIKFDVQLTEGYSKNKFRKKVMHEGILTHLSVEDSKEMDHFCLGENHTANKIIA